MVERLETLSTAQAQQRDAHADRWIEIALRTGSVPRRALTTIARRSCELAGLPWHRTVILVSSPLVLALAAPIAAVLIPWERQGLPATPVNGAVDAALNAALRAAADHLAARAAGAVRAQVRSAVHAAVAGAARGPVQPVVRFRAQVAQVAAAREPQRPPDLHGAALQREFDRVLSGGVRRALRPIADAVDGATAGAFSEVRDAAGNAVHAASTAAQRLHDSLGAGEQLATALTAAGLPFHAAGWVACMSFAREVCGFALTGDFGERARVYEQAVALSAWWYAHPDFLMMCERPQQIHRELLQADRSRGAGSHRLHRPDGPALAWSDGWNVYAVHGRRVPAWIIEQPERVTVAAIDSMPNAEVRRMMIERYGWGRYMHDSNAQVVDECGADHPIVGLRGARLLRKELPGEPEPMVLLEMVNSTPELDGSYKRYLERIDPKAYGGDAGRLCHAAMASRWRYRDEDGELVRTFQAWEDYVPSAES